MNDKSAKEYISTEEIEKRSIQILRDNKITQAPVDPVKIASMEGIKVLNAKFSEDDMSGMISKNGDELIILVNYKEYPHRKRFTIAHELGHYFLHLNKDGEFIDRSYDLFRVEDDIQTNANKDKLKEVQANKFAAAILMPRELINKAIEKTKDIEELSEMFEVSQSAIGFRVSNLGVL